MIETIRIESRSPANDAMHFVPFGEQELGEIRSILSRNAGDKGPRSSLHRKRSQWLLQSIGFQLLSAPCECASEHPQCKTRVTYDKPPYKTTQPARPAKPWTNRQRKLGLNEKPPGGPGLIKFSLLRSACHSISQRHAGPALPTPVSDRDLAQAGIEVRPYFRRPPVRFSNRIRAVRQGVRVSRLVDRRRASAVPPP